MSASDISNKAQEVIDEAFSRHPPQTPITKTNIAHARRLITFVFDDFDDGSKPYPGDAQKRRAFQQLDSATLAALSVLIRVRDIRARGIPIIEAICAKAPSVVLATCWYNDVDLWKAFLGVPSNSAEYGKFRKDAVDAILQPAAPRHPATAPPLSGSVDAVPGSEDVAGFTCPSCNSRLPEGKGLADGQDTGTNSVDVPGMRHIPPTAGNPPSFAAPTAAEPSHAAAAHARTDPKESQNALPRLAFMLGHLESRDKTDDDLSGGFPGPAPNPLGNPSYKGGLRLSQFTGNSFKNTHTL